ncbi:hypothetical protein, conserved [Eimeria tenella]|uniref:EF hand domain-containing protein n=1 Tax=Eimeria tenella TaxID=5802 RepID=U6L7X6_EIMTE|nr:hypothetical protein, conserved [Eimeria tenella]CDJ45313.1 hypothetical protein, conserved [Eimeria tenella]|eukprot:XP_013236059.1 hypothetical protein, conserved [Eimeria tenella]
MADCGSNSSSNTASSNSSNSSSSSVCFFQQKEHQKKLQQQQALQQQKHEAPKGGVHTFVSSSSTAAAAAAAAAAAVSYAPSAEELQQYLSLFAANDPQGGAGLLGGTELRPLLAASGLPAADLAAAWAAADADGDGCLSCFEFAAAMSLAAKRRQGAPIPLLLPPELHPQALQQQHRRLQQQQQQQQVQQQQQQAQPDWGAGFDAFGDTTDASGGPAAAAEAAAEAAATAEDTPEANKDSSKRKPRSTSPRSSSSKSKSKARAHSSSDDEAAAEGQRGARSSSSKRKEQRKQQRQQQQEAQQQQQQDEEDADLNASWGRDKDWESSGDEFGEQQQQQQQQQLLQQQLEQHLGQQQLRSRSYEYPDEDDQFSLDISTPLQQQQRRRKQQQQQQQQQGRNGLHEGGRETADSAVALLESVVECDKRLATLMGVEVDLAADELLQLRSVAAALQRQLITEKQQLAAAIDRRKEFEALLQRERIRLEKLQEARRSLEMERIGAHRDIQHYQEELLFLKQQVAAAEADLRSLADAADATRMQQQQQQQQLEALDSERRIAVETLKSEKDLLAKEEREIEEMKLLLQRLRREKTDGQSQHAVLQEKLRQTEHDVVLQRAALDSAHTEAISTLQQRVQQQQQKQKLISELNQHTQETWAAQRMRALEGPHGSGGPRGLTSAAAAAAAAAAGGWTAAEAPQRRDLKGVPSGGGGGFFLSSPRSVHAHAMDTAPPPANWRTFKAPTAADLVMPRGGTAAAAATLGITDFAAGAAAAADDSRDLRRHLEGLSIDSVKSDTAFVCFAAAAAAAAAV